MATIQTTGDDLHQKARRILQAIHENDAPTSTTDIRHTTGISATSIWKHTRPLLIQNLIQDAGIRDVNAPTQANSYAITDEGRRIADRIDDPLSYEELTARLEQTQDRVEVLEHHIDELAQKHGNLVDLVKQKL